jgi:hypothetical protein
MTTSRAGKISLPSTLNIAEAARLLESTSRAETLSTRLDTLSRSLMGRPNVENSLVGGPETAEVLTISLEAFDCVTYIEAVLGLAFSRSVSAVVTTIRDLRYEGGVIDWRRRNHYMVDWARNNEVRGMIDNLTKGPHTVEKTRTLGSINGLPARQAIFRCFPRQRLPQMSPECETGDLILFASTKKRLDVFHVGLLVRREDSLMMRHATRTAGCVIEQNLEEFIQNNRMSGFILLRPVQPHSDQTEL